MRTVQTGDVRRVVVFGLGGTISMTATTGGVVPTLSARQVVDSVAAVAGLGVTVDAVDYRRKPGWAVTADDLVGLAADIRAALTAGATGVVVTQGTDTIEESAYLLDLLHDGDAPVVVTGAMRNPTLAGSDGPANLLAAIQVAASAQLRGLGVLVVLADEVHAARHVAKGHTSSVAAFGSRNAGPVGYIVEGTPVLAGRPVGRFTVPLVPGSRWAGVGLHVLTLDDDGVGLRAAADQRDGLVVAGFGGGHVTENAVPVLAELAARMPVVLASRAGAGRVLTATYASPGSERDLVGRGLVPAGFLDPYKARILLAALLSAGADRAAVSAGFSAAGGTGDPGDWSWPTAPETTR